MMPQLECEVSRVLESAQFARSPSQKRLLRYLADRAGKGSQCCTQYDIATEALGRGTDFNETTDSSVRVQMSRLRKSLQAYYATNLPGNKLCLYIRPGEYRLRSARKRIAYPELKTGAGAHVAQPTVPPTPGKSQRKELVLASSLRKAASSLRHATEGIKNLQQSRSRWMAITCVLVIALLFGFGQNGEFSNSPAQASGRTNSLEVPRITLDLEVSDAFEQIEGLENLRQRLRFTSSRLLQKSLVSRVFEGESLDYILNIQVRNGRDGRVETFVSLRDESDRLVSEDFLASAADADAIVNSAREQILQVISPTGTLSRSLAESIDGQPRNDFECFILIENNRENVVQGNALIDFCLDEFPDGEHRPYVEARKVFEQVQKRLVDGEAISSNSTEWLTLADLLDRAPDNSYANSLAAKLLIAGGDCLQAREYAEEALSRGRTFPALEMSVIVDSFGCPPRQRFSDRWYDRTHNIAEAYPDPNSLLRTYILLGAIVSGENEVDFSHDAFQTGKIGTLDRLNASLERSLNGEATEADMAFIRGKLPALLFSQNTRDLVLSEIRKISKNSAS